MSFVGDIIICILFSDLARFAISDCGVPSIFKTVPATQRIEMYEYMALFSTQSQFVTCASAPSEDFRKSQRIDTYNLNISAAHSKRQKYMAIFQPMYLPHHKLYVRNFLPINSTAQCSTYLIAKPIFSMVQLNF